MRVILECEMAHFKIPDSSLIDKNLSFPIIQFMKG